MDTKKILEDSLKRSDEAEIFTVVSEKEPVGFEANRLKTLSKTSGQGWALRVIKDRRIGLSTSTYPNSETLISRACDASDFGKNVEYSFPSNFSYKKNKNTEINVPLDKMVDMGEKIIKTLLKEWPSLLLEANISRSSGFTKILNSSGFNSSYEWNSFSAGVGGTLVKGEDMLFVWESFGWSEFKDYSDVIINSLHDQLKNAENISETPNENCPVIFTPRGFVTTFIAPLISSFNGINIVEGISPISEKMGQKIFDENITIVDDPTINGALGERPFDDEGVPASRNTLIENGVISGNLLNLESASKLNLQPTGSASRSISSPPTPSTSVIEVKPGKYLYKELISGLKEGIIVDQLLGAGQGNELGGDFKGNVLLGYRVKDGKILGRIKNTMISGNVFDCLKNLSWISRDTNWIYGSFNVPHIMCENIQIASSA